MNMFDIIIIILTFLMTFKCLKDSFALITHYKKQTVCYKKKMKDIFDKRVRFPIPGIPQSVPNYAIIENILGDENHKILVDVYNTQEIGILKLKKPTLCIILFSKYVYIHDVITKDEKKLGTLTLYLNEFNKDICNIKIDASLAKYLCDLSERECYIAKLTDN